MTVGVLFSGFHLIVAGCVIAHCEIRHYQRMRVLLQHNLERLAAIERLYLGPAKQPAEKLLQ